jgi:hypothetical protein
LSVLIRQRPNGVKLEFGRIILDKRVVINYQFKIYNIIINEYYIYTGYSGMPSLIFVDSC